MNLLFTDEETTGLSPKNNEIFELATALYVDGVKHFDMCLYARPERWDTISDQALAVNRWTRERLKALPNRDVYCDAIFNQIIKYFSYTNKKYKIVEHSRNGKFDIEFIKNEWNDRFERLPFSRIFHPTAINTRDLVKKKLPNLESYTLLNCARALGIPVDESKLHGAAYDRDLLIQVYQAAGGRW